MAENSKISWTTHTFNPWVGCARVSPACDHCYAESWAKRTGNAALWTGERRRTSEKNWARVRKWDRDAAVRRRAWDEGVALAGGDEAALLARGFLKPERPRVFCASLADVFDNQVPAEWRVELWQLIHDTPNLDWLLLTKRPQNIAKMLPDEARYGGSLNPNYLWPWPNVWLGTTVENQAEADRRIPHLLAVPAAVRFLSVEPLLGPVDLLRDLYLRRDGQRPNELSMRLGDYVQPLRGNFRDSPRIDWVIVGGESGHGARPFNLSWAASLRRQCSDAGVAFWMKQLGHNPVWDYGAPHMDGIWTGKGDDPAEWPPYLRGQELPQVRHAA